MSHPNVCGKPLLIVANKQDINDSVDIVDVTYFFGIDDTSQTFGTPYKIVASGTNYRMELNDGIDWLIDCIIKNYKTLKNRILFNRLLTPIKRIKRQRTSLMKKVSTNKIWFYIFCKKKTKQTKWYIFIYMYLADQSET